MKQTIIKFCYAFICGIVILLFNGCKSDDEGSLPLLNEIQFTERIISLPESTNALFIESSANLLVYRNQNSFLSDSISTGDLITVESPIGNSMLTYLKRVSSKTINGDVISFETENVSICEVILDGYVEYEFVIFDGQFSLSELLADDDNNPNTISDIVQIDASYNVKLEATFGIGVIQNQCVTNVEFKLEIENELGVKIGTEVRRNIEEQLYKKEFTPRLINPFIWITPAITIDGGGSFSVENNLNFTGSVIGTYEHSISNTGGLFDVSNESSLELTSDIEYNSRIASEVYLKFSGEIWLYSLEDTKIATTLKSSINIEIPSGGNCSIKGNLDLEGGIYWEFSNRPIIGVDNVHLADWLLYECEDENINLNVIGVRNDSLLLYSGENENVQFIAKLPHWYNSDGSRRNYSDGTSTKIGSNFYYLGDNYKLCRVNIETGEVEIFECEIPDNAYEIFSYQDQLYYAGLCEYDICPRYIERCLGVWNTNDCEFMEMSINNIKQWIFGPRGFYTSYTESDSLLFTYIGNHTGSDALCQTIDASSNGTYVINLEQSSERFLSEDWLTEIFKYDGKYYFIGETTPSSSSNDCDFLPDLLSFDIETFETEVIVENFSNDCDALFQFRLIEGGLSFARTPFSKFIFDGILYMNFQYYPVAIDIDNRVELVHNGFANIEFIVDIYR